MAVPDAFHNIGICTEGDAIVAATGCELISRKVPAKADEIQALMQVLSRTHGRMSLIGAPLRRHCARAYSPDIRR